MSEEKYSIPKNLINESQTVVIVNHSSEDKFVYAIKPSLKVMEQFYKQSISKTDNIRGNVFDRYWKFDEDEGIRGSSTFLALRFDKQALRPNGLWIPGLLEAKALESAGKLENGVYRDYGIIIYNSDIPNKQVANKLILQAKNLGLELPLIIPFRALDYVQNEDNKSIVELSLFGSGKGIIQGKEAIDNMHSLNSTYSGARRFLRGRLGRWNASWDNLNDSDGTGRIDWICGEETEENLRTYMII